MLFSQVIEIRDIMVKNNKLKPKKRENYRKKDECRLRDKPHIYE